MKKISAFAILLFILTGCTGTQDLKEITQTNEQIDKNPTQSPTITLSSTQTSLPTLTSTAAPTPTLVPNLDEDLDGLSNYEESVKYHTNPFDPDSDGDGILDFDWDERREFVYTVHVLMKLRQPFNIDEMNDTFQDVKIIKEEDQWGYITIDAIIYPETELEVEPSSYPLAELSDELFSFIEPGFSTNYSPEMQNAVIDIVGSTKTDVEAVENILNWIENRTSLADLPYQPEIFYFTYLYNEKVFLRNPPDLPPTKMLYELFYADSMFEKQVHGTCCSTATLKCAMIKSAGIPCKIIQTLFPVFSHMDQIEPYENRLQREWNNRFENQPSGQSSIQANHCFLEVYLGSQWVRVDNEINIYHGGSDWLSIKILSVPDLTDVDFSRTYPYPIDWINNRPYYTLLIEDQEPIYKLD